MKKMEINIMVKFFEVEKTGQKHSIFYQRVILNIKSHENDSTCKCRLYWRGDN
jgi:hypothetical protein